MGEQIQRVRDAIELKMRQGKDPKRVEVTPSVLRDLRREAAEYQRLESLDSLKIAEVPVVKMAKAYKGDIRVIC